MSGTLDRFPEPTLHGETARSLATRLSHAESALRLLTASQVDAIIHPDGKAYLLHPAQESLRQNERRLQAIIDSSADAICVLDRAGVILSQSRAVTPLLGYEPEELVGSRIFDFIYEEDLARVHSAFSSVIEGLWVNATVRFYHPLRGGSWRQIEATIGKLHDGASENVFFNLRPVTSLPPEQQADAASPSSLSSDRVLAMNSHELRTPLAAVLLGIDELQGDERFSTADPTLAMMRRNVDLQSRLLGDLVDFTSIGQNKLRLQLDAIDAHRVIRYVQEICRGDLATSQIDLRLDLRASDNVVLADPLRLQQVLWNLLENAIKFSPRSSIICICTADGSQGHLVIDVADNGIGIEPALLPHVFDCFHQGDIPNDLLPGSLGLGLFIAKEMTIAHGGTLTAHSPGRGKGATFRLTLKTAQTSTR